MRCLSIVMIFSRLGKDHASRRGLENAGHNDANVGIEKAPPAVHDNHRTVFEVPNTLPGLFALLDDVDAHFLTRQHRGLDRIC